MMSEIPQIFILIQIAVHKAVVDGQKHEQDL